MPFQKSSSAKSTLQPKCYLLEQKMKTFIKLFVLFICFLQCEKYYELRKTRFKLRKNYNRKFSRKNRACKLIPVDPWHIFSAFSFDAVENICALIRTK